MPNVVVAFEIDREEAAELASAVREGDGFRVVGRSEFPSFIPKTLAAKMDSATRIISGSGGETPVILYNFRRIDGSEVDEHPYGAMLISGSVAISSSFLEHGSWASTKRTTRITPSHQAHISASGIGNYYLQHPPEGRLSGSLEELSKTDQEAFGQFIHSAINQGV